MPVNTKYKNYSVKDFLKDDLFLQWQLLSTETLDNYWKQVLQENPHQEANITNAAKKKMKFSRIYMHVTTVIKFADSFIGLPV